MYFSEQAQTAASQTQATTTLPVFLFAGQSNMQGNVDPTLFQTITDILASKDGNKQQRIANALNTWYKTYSDGYAKYAYNPAVSALEAQQTMALKHAGYIDANFPKPPSNNLAYCTDDSSPAEPLAANCGNPFGPELTFSRVYATGVKTPFTVVKVVQGGTTLAQDWISPSASNNQPGPMWQQLAARIKSLTANPSSVNAKCTTSNNCQFQAFVWYQGENDAFAESDANAYASNLKHFISDVRTAIGNPNFPVVIVQVGAWVKTLPYGATVLQAQAAVAQSTPNCTMVVTDDLSEYYHLDPAAQMIIGDRVSAGIKKLKPA